MFWTRDKLAARIHEIGGFRYRDCMTVNGMKRKFDEEGAVGAYPPDLTDGEEIRLGDRWVGRDLYMWLGFEAHIPEEWKGRTVLGLFDLGRTGGGGCSGFESLLFLNGKPYQGVDTNHEEVFLPAETAGTTLEFRFRMWSGLNGMDPAAPIENRLHKAAICWLDEAADDLYYTARAVLETVELLDENRPEHHELLSALDRTFLQIDFSRPGSDEFYASIADARETLRTRLDRIPKHHAVTVRCIGHTHIDVAWLWRLKHTREKGARSFSTVLRLMELFPDYVFLQTQPQLYDYIAADYPELHEQMKSRIAEGRWEADGAMWLEADCNLTSGESLVRQLMYGSRFFKERYGKECKYLWLPDVFGYSWALPQILRKSGIEMFMTTKISWNQYNRMPHDTFKWRGIDGSEVLTHFITTPDAGGGDAWFYTYNGTITPKTVQGIWDAYRDKDLNKELLLAYGYGDGGGGVNRTMLEMRRRLETMPGLPHVTTGRADEYFERLKAGIAETDRYVHTWDGELYLELHRGTYTSQAYNKRANRKLELLYREAEWMGVLGSLKRGTWSVYKQESLYEGWKIILRNQFHDIIPGSSIGEVYEDSRLEYAEAFERGREAWQAGAADLVQAEHKRSAAGGYCVTLFNSASWERKDTVRIPAEDGMENGVWFDAEGCALPAQRSGSDWIVQVEGLPSMGYTTVCLEEGRGAPSLHSPFQTGNTGLSTPFYEIEWNGKGQLTRIYDKQFRREVLALGAAGNVLQVFEDKPVRHEAWDIDIFYGEKMREVDQLLEASIVENGPVRAAVRFRWTYGRSVVTQLMIVYAADRRIDFETHVDWHEQQQLLKVAFPVEVRSTEATYDIQFGNVKRPTHWNTSWDYARFESVGHQWADLSERGYGVSLLNDCKYGYDIKDNVLRLSLIKSAVSPDPKADQGEHVFTYALLPHEGDWLQGGTVASAWALNNPVASVTGRPEESGASLLRLSGADHIFVDAVKKAEDSEDVIVRFHEYAGIRGKVVLTSDSVISGWQPLDLMERPVGEAQMGTPVTFTVKPYEIVTLMLKFGE